MQIKKRKHIESAKTGANPQMKTVDIEANPQLSSNGSAPNKQLTAKTGSFTDMSVVAKLRSARKDREEAQAPRKLEGEVSLGPTETSSRENYLNRIKKRAK